MTEIIDLACWWSGAIVLSGCLLYGLMRVAWLIVSHLIREFGMWVAFQQALRIMYRERRTDRPAQ